MFVLSKPYKSHLIGPKKSQAPEKVSILCRCGGTDLRCWRNKSKAMVEGELVYFSLSVLYGKYTAYTSVYKKNRFTVHSIHYIYRPGATTPPPSFLCSWERTLRKNFPSVRRRKRVYTKFLSQYFTNKKYLWQVMKLVSNRHKVYGDTLL